MFNKENFASRFKINVNLGIFFVLLFLILLARFIISFLSGYLLPDEALYVFYSIRIRLGYGIQYYSITRSMLSTSFGFFLMLINFNGNFDSLLLILFIWIFTINFLSMFFIIKGLNITAKFSTILYLLFPVNVLIIPFLLTESLANLIISIQIFTILYLIRNKKNYFPIIFIELFSFVCLVLTRETFIPISGLILFYTVLLFLYDNQIPIEMNSTILISLLKRFYKVIILFIFASFLVGFLFLNFGFHVNIISRVVNPNFFINFSYAFFIGLFLGINPIFLLIILIYELYYVTKRIKISRLNLLFQFLILGGFISYFISIFVVADTGNSASFYIRLSYVLVLPGFLIILDFLNEEKNLLDKVSLNIFKEIKKFFHKYTKRFIFLSLSFLVISGIILSMILPGLFSSFLTSAQGNLTDQRFINQFNIPYSPYDRFSPDYKAPWVLLSEFSNNNSIYTFYSPNLDNQHLGVREFIYDNNISLVFMRGFSFATANSTFYIYGQIYVGFYENVYLKNLLIFSMFNNMTVPGYSYHFIWLNYESFLIYCHRDIIVPNF